VYTLHIFRFAAPKTRHNKGQCIKKKSSKKLKKPSQKAQSAAKGAKKGSTKLKRGKLKKQTQKTNISQNSSHPWTRGYHTPFV